jgi:glycine/D-amino acid oxidase-like deaminating enzyme
MTQYRKKPVVITAITFAQLVGHGIASGGNVVNGMPWSFTYNGHAITHENDGCYIIPTLEGSMKMGRDDMLITGVKGEIYPCKREIFEATYEPAHEVVDAELMTLLDTASGGPPLSPISDAVLEQQIREGGAAVAPRVTADEIDALCKDLVIHMHHFPGTTTTVAVAALPDGFVVATGHSACISPENFKADIGARIASDNARTAARAKLWELEGYLLRASLVNPDALFAGGIMAGAT